MDAEEKARRFDKIQSWLWFYINDRSSVNIFRSALAEEMVRELKIPKPTIAEASVDNFVWDQALHAIDMAHKYHDNANNLELIANAIEEDIRDRRGLKNEWCKIDEAIRKEIKDIWVEIMKTVLISIRGEKEDSQRRNDEHDDTRSITGS